MNVVSFSLYGTHPRYLIGAARNLELAKKFYPGWGVAFCVPWTAPLSLYSEFLPALHVRQYSDLDIPDMFLRLVAADGFGIGRMDRIIFRDCDSRISEREVEAVQDWIASDKILHIMRDHPAHRLVPGGMFGLQVQRDNWDFPCMYQLIREWMKETEMDPHAYGADEEFLDRKIWPMLNGSVIQHDIIPGRREELSAWNCRPWPKPRKDWPRFVGEVFEINELGEEYPRPGDWENIPKE